MTDVKPIVNSTNDESKKIADKPNKIQKLKGLKGGMMVGAAAGAVAGAAIGAALSDEKTRNAIAERISAFAAKAGTTVKTLDETSHKVRNSVSDAAGTVADAADTVKNTVKNGD